MQKQSASVGPGGENHDEWSPLTPMSSPGFDPRCLALGNEPGGVTHAYSQGPANDLANPRNNNPLCGKYFHDTILICVYLEFNCILQMRKNICRVSLKYPLSV